SPGVLRDGPFKGISKINTPFFADEFRLSSATVKRDFPGYPGDITHRNDRSATGVIFRPDDSDRAGYRETGFSGFIPDAPIFFSPTVLGWAGYRGDSPPEAVPTKQHPLFAAISSGYPDDERPIFAAAGLRGGGPPPGYPDDNTDLPAVPDDPTGGHVSPKKAGPLSRTVPPSLPCAQGAPQPKSPPQKEGRRE
ncbi:MAG: hypothetical protein BJ554DRAFT_7795, partial [Olpidium bornovanus]